MYFISIADINFLGGDLRQVYYENAGTVQVCISFTPRGEIVSANTILLTLNGSAKGTL